MVSFITPVPKIIYNVPNNNPIIHISRTELICAEIIKESSKCQKNYRTTNQDYGNIPFRGIEVLPWNTIHVDLVDTCTVLFKTVDETNMKTFISALTAVRSATY